MKTMRIMFRQWHNQSHHYPFMSILIVFQVKMLAVENIIRDCRYSGLLNLLHRDKILKSSNVYLLTDEPR